MRQIAQTTRRVILATKTAQTKQRIKLAIRLTVKTPLIRAVIHQAMATLLTVAK